VEGPRNLVEPLLNLSTESFDIAGAREDVVREVKLNLQGKDIHVEPSKPIRVRVQIVRSN